MRAEELSEKTEACPEQERFARPVVDTIFWGGGTPSLMSGAMMERAMDVLRAHYEILPDAEISMEMNPGTADADKISSFHRAGINRLSIGVQSLNDKELKMLGRIHTAEEAESIFRLAREAGFDNINVDLMSALPGQTMESWKKTLDGVLAWAPEHISAYSLIIEEGTPFATLFEAGKLPGLPSEEEDRDIYHYTKARLEECGYHRYEISNYAKKGKACRHNVGYWTGHDYIGFGLGASSMVRGVRFSNPADMESYRKAIRMYPNTVCAKVNPLRCGEEVLSDQDKMEEFMFLGLRMTEGVSEEEFRNRFGTSISDIYSDVLQKQEKQNLILRENGRIRLSEYGMDIANYVMADYLLG